MSEITQTIRQQWCIARPEHQTPNHLTVTTTNGVVLVLCGLEKYVASDYKSGGMRFVPITVSELQRETDALLPKTPKEESDCPVCHRHPTQTKMVMSAGGMIEVPDCPELDKVTYTQP